jgi:hypothetical protein
LNFTQLPIISTKTTEIFKQVNYPLTVSHHFNLFIILRKLTQPCDANSDTELSCKTPELRLPSKEDFGNFTAEFKVGFEFDAFDEYKELDEERHNISLKITVFELPPIERHFWPPCDPSKKEVLILEVYYPPFNIMCCISCDDIDRCPGAHSNTRLWLSSAEWLRSSKNAMTAVFSSRLLKMQRRRKAAITHTQWRYGIIQWG